MAAAAAPHPAGPTVTDIAETQGVSSYGVCVAPDGGIIFSSYSPSHRISRLDPETREVITLAGDGTCGFQDGPGATARFNTPRGVAVDGDGNVFVADQCNHRIRRIDAETRVVSTVAGDGTAGFQDGPGATAMFHTPTAVAVDGDGNVFVADQGNHRIRRIDAETRVVSTVAGDGTAGFQDGPAATARFFNPFGVDVDGGNNLIVCDYKNHRIRRIDAATSEVTTLAGGGTAGFRDGPGATARFYNPFGVDVDGDDNLIVCDYSNHRVRRIDAATSEVTTLAGSGTAGFRDGPGATANFNYPQDITVDGDGNFIVCDNSTYRVRRIDAATSEVTTVAGNGTNGNVTGRAESASFGGLSSAAIDGDGNVIVADRGNTCLKIITGLNLQPRTFKVGHIGFHEQVERQQAKCDRAEAKRAALHAALVELQAELDDATAERDHEAEALARLQADVAGFRDRVAREGVDELDQVEAYEVLLLLGVTTVRPSVLVKQEIAGAVLPDLTEGQMRDVFKISRLGDRRRLSVALRRLANRQGFPPASDGQPGAIGWGEDEVGAWLREHEFGGLVDRFAAEGIDGQCLLELRVDDFKALGVTTIGQGSKLKKQLERLKKVTYAGQLVRPGDGDGAAAAPGAAPLTIESVLEAVLQENAALQRRMAQRTREPAEADVPPQFLCPILSDVMADPVIAMDGHTYERAAIEAWFQRSDRSPMTNLAIAPVLVPNLAMRQQIAELT
eukprot:CAMPEP_0182948250 /NCGR_PEP_ID=MMETSP0105_2-20130417/59662_1 /TAXON_ID=81532 ORGANISM="Acanthoeca-like sp., Strain 10tr" /NCGR_SAMPLE_ID=MMETSP0105_2 /ASSEMBLY_ACC=CAM_ASM_000205 /LENGTH=730 /DNA_ID=CAMNT_0025088539 /DNA_START=72 /DNA_END=2264 /DNA_ORIENTATION=-